MKKYGSPPTNPATLVENNGYFYVILSVSQFCEFKHGFDLTVVALNLTASAELRRCQGLFHFENGGRACWVCCEVRLQEPGSGVWVWQQEVMGEERALFQDEADGLALSEICVLPSFCRWNGAGGLGRLGCREL